MVSVYAAALSDTARQERERRLDLEIRISSENLVKILWIASVVLGAIGLLMFIIGIIVAFVADDSISVLKGIAAIGGGLGLAVIPASLTNSVANMSSAMSSDAEAETES